MTQPHEPLPEDNEPEQFLRKSRLEDSELDMTPMIDCTFQLLIFFMVCSHIGKGATVELPKAKYGIPIPSKISVTLTVAKGDGDISRVFMGDGVDDAMLIKAGSPQEQEDAITQFVEENFSKSKDGKPYVLLKAERGVKHREVSRVAKAAARASDVAELYVA